MKYEELQKQVIQWAKDRDIFENSNALKQIDKTQEELNETLNALVADSGCTVPCVM